MALFKALFGKKEPVKEQSKPAPMPFDVTEGLSYMEVRERENSREKWMLMKAFADKGDEIALLDVGEEYLIGSSMVARDDDKAEEYLLAALAQGASMAAVRLGQKYLRSAFDVYDEMPDQTEEDKKKADEEFDRRFHQGTKYLVEAVEDTNAMAAEQAVEIIAGSLELGYNVGKFRNFFMNSVNQWLPQAVKQIEEETSSTVKAEAADAWYVLGCLYMYGVHYENDLDEAKECFERCVALDPSHPRARMTLMNPLFED